MIVASSSFLLASPKRSSLITARAIGSGRTTKEVSVAVCEKLGELARSKGINSSNFFICFFSYFLYFVILGIYFLI